MTRKAKSKKTKRTILKKTTKDTGFIKKVSKEPIPDDLLFKDKPIKFVSSERVEYLKFFVDEVLEAIQNACGIKDIAFVSDESAIGDFTVCCDGEDAVRKIREALEVSVSENDYIVDVAQRIKDARG